MTELKSCPFCGTNPEDPKFIASLISCGENTGIECGKCGAEWPKIAVDGISDDEILNHFNRRAPDPSREALVESFEAMNVIKKAVLGEKGFAFAVREHSGLSYHWPSLDIAEEKINHAITQAEKALNDDKS